MYSFKQAAVLAFYQLSDLLKAEGNYQIPSFLGMWKLSSQDITFNLCVDDFGIKYYNKEDVHHLIQTVQKIYDTKIDWTGRSFLGFELDWDYEKGTVKLRMPGYIEKACQCLNHPPLKTKQHSPFKCTPFTFPKKSNNN